MHATRNCVSPKLVLQLVGKVISWTNLLTRKMPAENKHNAPLIGFQIELLVTNHTQIFVMARVLEIYTVKEERR